VIELLKDKSVNPVTFDVLRKMKPMRQIECAELMLTVHNWTSSCAKALLAATKQNDLAKPDRPKKISGLTREQMARMEREMASLHQDFKQIEESYGDDILHLVVVRGISANSSRIPKSNAFSRSTTRSLSMSSAPSSSPHLLTKLDSPPTDLALGRKQIILLS
jgi:hypothetical protein